MQKQKQKKKNNLRAVTFKFLTQVGPIHKCYLGSFILKIIHFAEQTSDF